MPTGIANFQRKACDFASPSHDGFGFNRIEYKTPNRAAFTPSRVWRADFEAGLHWDTPRWRLSDLKEYYQIFQTDTAI